MVHGRFQPFHKGHMEYLEEAAARSQRLIVGITNPDPSRMKAEPEDEQRHLPGSNPFSYLDRYRMVRAAAREAGLDLGDVDIVPFPINHRALWGYYVPAGVTQYIRIFSPWGEKKRDLLAGAGYEVVDLAVGKKKLHSGERVRQALRRGTGWKTMVPPGVARVILESTVDLGDDE